MIAITHEGNTPETRFTIPPMESDAAFKVLYRHLGVSGHTELKHPISCLHLRSRYSPNLDEIVKRFPLLNMFGSVKKS